MRSRNICPKCAGQDLLVVNPWRQPDARYTNSTNVMRVTSVETQGKGFLSLGSRVDVGDFELWVCATCGYSELYAAGAESLADLARQGNPEVRRVAVKGEGGAYR